MPCTSSHSPSSCLHPAQNLLNYQFEEMRCVRIEAPAAGVLCVESHVPSFDRSTRIFSHGEGIIIFVAIAVMTCSLPPRLTPTNKHGFHGFTIIIRRERYFQSVCRPHFLPPTMLMWLLRAGGCNEKDDGAVALPPLHLPASSSLLHTCLD